MSRPHAAVAALAAALAALFAGCAPGANDELQTMVEGIAPKGASLVECNWQSNYGGSGGVKAFYGCAWVAAGDVGLVGSHVVAAANERGFTVYCDGNRKKLEVVGAHGPDVLSIEVVDRSHIDVAEFEIPRGHVLVMVSAQKHDSSQRRGSGPRCAP